MRILQFALLLGIATCISQPALATTTLPIPAPPKSMWMHTERVFAEKQLREVTVDVLVVPVQGGDNSFDPVERSLITRLMVDRLIESTDLDVPNPTPVFQILGAHRAAYPRSDVCSLASKVQADHILEVHANYDTSNEFSLKAILLDGECNSEVREQSWSELGFSDSSPPSISVQAVLDEVVQFVTDRPFGEPAKLAAEQPVNFEFPPSVQELLRSSEDSALQAAANLQLVAALHTTQSLDHARYQLFEQSLVQLNKVPASADAKRLLEARALAGLGRRPAAVAVLEDPESPHETALLAALNANLPELREQVEQMGTSTLDLMAWRDLLELERAYGEKRERPLVEEFTAQHPTWAPFLYRALRDTNSWADYSDATIKLGLEQLLPVKAQTLREIIDSASITHDLVSDLELTRIVWRHLDSIPLEDVHRFVQDKNNFSRVSTLDIIALARSLAVANHVRRVKDDLETRQIPEQAVKRINEFASIFSGHPSVALLKGRAMAEDASSATSYERSMLRAEAANESLKGLLWTGQMTTDGALAARSINGFLVHRNAGDPDAPEGTYRLWEDPYRYHEWPRTAAWSASIPRSEFDKGILQNCIDYKVNSFFCLKIQIEEQLTSKAISADEAADLLAQYDDRYHGNAQRVELEVALNRDAGETDPAIEALRSRIQAGSNDWSYYYALGRALKRKGEYEEAQQVFLSFPGFNGKGSYDAVSLSQWANDAGSMFYWIGQYEMAQPLLEISAGLPTGSSGYFSSGSRLSLIAGDLALAEEWTTARARRYQSTYALRDLQQLLHIRGESDLAWKVFEQAQLKRPNPHAWSGALVGHRVAGATIEEVADWIGKSESLGDMRVGSSASLHGRIKLSQRYLLLAGTMDRIPDAALADQIARYNFDRPTMAMRTTDVDRSGTEPVVTWRGVVRSDGLSVKHDDLIPTPPDTQGRVPSYEIESRYQMLATGMTALEMDDCDEAFRIFNNAAYFYFLDEYLPYHALCAAELGYSAHLMTALQAREESLAATKRSEDFDNSMKGYRFDEDLTYAVLASHAGEHDEAMNWLQRAMNNRPYIEDRSIYPYYQVVDLADRLYEESGDASYREYALDLARRHTIVLPMYSWAYFVVAQYSESEAERLAALASGLALDPGSHRAAQLPKSMIEQATKFLAENDPPYLNRQQLADLGT